MITSKNLSEMSDFEINKEVAKIFLECDYIYEDDKVALIGVTTFLGGYGEPEEREVKYGEFDPCNNPNDIMPIAFDNKISLNYLGPLTDEWAATIDDIDEDCYSENKNPLRAACESYILMNQ